MDKHGYNRHYHSRRRKYGLSHIFPIIIGCTALVGLGGFGVCQWIRRSGRTPGESTVVLAESGHPMETYSKEDGFQEGNSVQAGMETEAMTSQSGLDRLLSEADILASGYDYDGAIALLQESAEYAGLPEVAAAITSYQAVKETLVNVKIGDITHVFFHSLVVDPSKAFDGDADEAGYNQVMTTVDEFKKILQSMYDKGYVLVRLHDMAYETTDETGKAVMKPGTIMLPEGKIPFVMSQDDVCYYPYMDNDGFATRIVIGNDGYPTCEMRQDDGSTVTGPYDLVPILEDFIQEHPDFSYKGARAVLAFTGYEGILGYRTAASYADKNPNYEQDRQAAAQVAQCLKDHGWELASHSWGHLNLGDVSWDRFQSDADKWENEVDSLIGPIDIILYPFGADINDWHPYTHDNVRYDYLYQCGFRYFCNVDSAPHWVQIGDDYMRQGRRNLDGYRMWKDIMAEADGRARKLEDLFHAEDVFDSARPTPVPDM